MLPLGIGVCIFVAVTERRVEAMLNRWKTSKFQVNSLMQPYAYFLLSREHTWWVAVIIPDGCKPAFI